MSNVVLIFEHIEKLIKFESHNEFIKTIFKNITTNDVENINQIDSFQYLNKFIGDCIQEMDKLAVEIKTNHSTLISVKNQKLLRTCFQLISSFGISPCLIPGLGISPSKRFMSMDLPQLILSDEQKYDMLVTCTDFLHRSYDVPVFKNIIITFHLSDYLAALIQLSFAPLKKPGVYPHFTMTQEMYDKIIIDREKYIQIYEYLTTNCFQPILMKEMIVLQNVQDQKCPLFVKKVIAKEMSRRLTVSGGLLSLIRCFIDSHDLDIGLEWKKIAMISKIVSTKHGNMDECEYLQNITSQLKDIFAINNEKYMTTAVSCLITLYQKYQNSENVKNLVNMMFRSLDYDRLLSDSTLPGTVILTPQEIEYSIQILNCCTSLNQVTSEIILPNVYLLFLLRIKSTNAKMKLKITSIILKAFDLVNKTEIYNLVKQLLFGKVKSDETDIVIEEYGAGLTVKYVNSSMEYPKDQAVTNFLELFQTTENNTTISKLFESCLQIFADINARRHKSSDSNIALDIENESILLNSDSQKYAHMVTILSEISTSEKIRYVFTDSPDIVINFVDMILFKNVHSTDDECKTIALVLLNTILSNTSKTCDLKEKLQSFLPNLRKLTLIDSAYINILAEESISLILSEYPKVNKSPFDKALSNISDSLLPVRAHGILELKKLIDIGDPETISKRHYIFCLLQEQLTDPDSYIYLSTINCISALALHCTSEVLNVLCKEYLDDTTEIGNIDTKNNLTKANELRMKIGDVIVKVTKQLGEIAVVYKTILLNTVLCNCRDNDPLIRASALSNLAEIALVLNYKMGTIIYEVLLCIWNIIETDKAIECRRAAVMVISSLLKGLGKEMLIELKDNLLPIYRTLNKLYNDSNEDSIVKLHAQLALEELNDTVKQYIFAELPVEKEFTMLREQKDIIFK